MTAAFEKLERRLDRLERFFSKKRRVQPDSIAIGDGPISPLSLSPKPGAVFQTFPQPSFIRPMSTRMLAREEIAWTSKSNRRAQSLPESPSTPRLMSLTDSANEPATTPVSSDENFPYIPQRISSLSHRHRTASLAELLEFSFSSENRKSADSSLSSPISRSRPTSRSILRPTSPSVSPKAQLNRKRNFNELRVEGLIAQHPDPNTPPLSAHQNKSFALMQLQHRMLIPELLPYGNPTPETSPRLVPLPEPEADELELDQTVMLERPKSLDASVMVPKAAISALRKSTSLSNIVAGAAIKRDPILKEPSFSDFLSLSDDDIADGQPVPRAQLPAASEPPSFSLPPDPPALVATSLIANAYPLLTLSPPLATRPATAAAFEAARIAARYGFDLVYVVNLWPHHIASSQQRPVTKKSSFSSLSTSATVLHTPSSPQDSMLSGTTYVPSTDGQVSAGIDKPDKPRMRMTGRLLAAYGLPSIMFPFRISAPVHQKMLKNEGWLEYRSDNAAADEFARGYSCSFYTGYNLDGRLNGFESEADSDTKTRKRKGRAANRGIVFSAYRLPRADGSSLGSDTEELEALRRDAETLVDMLIDIHMTQRQRRPSAPKLETGPLPEPKTPTYSD
ncbi:hypothetical protein B0T26DRAFT_73000 [Lasiosphaeria miniovina]|uniref:Uncharacterized protein n=1 Tax=Lasiosphaeria miniovina TaxID=1954250 RepID=A0AA40BHQ7_9PEZI|nr:uncharacterized protein B0T26DRAFT_73000 [Lasiosphaeria miniovina]KAK0734462.1 hypothetical protein B0T26DRAFT_73000 [Lasiosphaeria miniovina]